MIKIYHNPRCRKSREALAILEKSGENFEVVKYLENIPTEKELTNVIEMLEITPIELVRKTEKIWKENYKVKVLTDSEIINAMLKNPKLIERPIVINGNKARIGRPSESILEII